MNVNMQQLRTGMSHLLNDKQSKRLITEPKLGFEITEAGEQKSKWNKTSTTNPFGHVIPGLSSKNQGR